MPKAWQCAHRVAFVHSAEKACENNPSHGPSVDKDENLGGGQFGLLLRYIMELYSNAINLTHFEPQACSVVGLYG